MSRASGHGERQHAILSASSAHRWMTCTPSARLEQQFPDTTSEAAKEGTLAHELAELKLRHYFFTTDLTRRKYTTAANKLKKDPLWSDEMEGYTDTYLDYVKQIALSALYTPSARIEARVDFGGYTHKEPGNKIEGTGIADCILIYGNVLHIIDFKYGKGVPVSAENNPQLCLYALGAYEMYKILYPIDMIRTAIIQPRISSEPSEWVLPVPDLLEFGGRIREKAALAWEGKGEFNPGEEACRFCRARAQCRARAEYNTQLAFHLSEKPPLLSPEEAGEYLAKGKDIASWMKDIEEWALSECLAGKRIPGWKAVEGRSVRAWTDQDAAFSHIIEESLAPQEMLYERKPLTLAQVEKLLGKSTFSENLSQFITKSAGKPTLVPESDRREAITNKVTASEAFKEVIK